MQLNEEPPLSPSVTTTRGSSRAIESIRNAWIRKMETWGSDNQPEASYSSPGKVFQKSLFRLSLLFKDIKIQ
ncbi:hypothetical protein F2Q70_00015175 [Brassica cretica]|uniref:Uncharacterized protein n=1 Tax=Brassica cretica TaxID=69181 RepID=A0A8S9I5Y8_BRACR|nr:hypothetical protein F2Q70_00015175 [Brassica cretica]